MRPSPRPSAQPGPRARLWGTVTEGGVGGTKMEQGGLADGAALLLFS